MCSLLNATIALGDETDDVSCDFLKSDKCGYTTGSCWNSNPLSYGTYGKPGATYIIIHVTIHRQLIS